ncbi:hypothetical protein CgunFtcFv8_022695 [Champsocephalus gunnari]|uniref:Uncharacterized protein n=1 Tax=Champsocephalus gunnari TaxID=52237 RepID=A0AAN8DRC7_CHAGU|nr:hypothetical protein CgunFtcFv8_022695 [Champsocephalus gunnari]
MRHSGGSPRTVRAAGRWGTQEAARAQSEQQDDEALRRQPAHSQSSRTDLQKCVVPLLLLANKPGSIIQQGD